MSNLAWAEMDGAAPEHGDAYLARPNTWEEQRRWPLPPEGGAVRIGRASSADVCISEDSQVSRVHAVLERSQACGRSTCRWLGAVGPPALHWRVPARSGSARRRLPHRAAQASRGGVPYLTSPEDPRR
jgi:hypothetical protein